MYRFSVVFTSVVVCIFASTAPEASLTNLDGRIVGGRDTTIEEYPHQVVLRYLDRHHCGGSIYSRNVVITAAHCVRGHSARYLTIQAGVTRLSDAGVKIQVSKVYVHHKYNSYLTDNDVAVLILEESLIFSESIQPIPLQDSNVEVEPGTIAEVTGWGAVFEGGYTSDVLQSVKVKIVDSRVCAKNYERTHPITKSMLCAGVDGGGRDACQGDSGGPLIANGKLVGIVSWGFGCARPRYPGVYAKVSYLHDWIKSKAGEHS